MRQNIVVMIGTSLLKRSLCNPQSRSFEYCSTHKQQFVCIPITNRLLFYFTNN